MFQCARFQPLSLSFQLTSSPNVFISSSIRLSWYKPQRDNLDLIVILAQDSFSLLGATFHLTVVFSCFDRVRVYCARSLNKQELDLYLISRKKGNSRLYLLWLKCVEPWTKFYVSFPIWPWQSSWLESVVWIPAERKVCGLTMDMEIFFMASLQKMPSLVILEGTLDAI